MRRDEPIGRLIEATLRGETRAVARLLSLVENDAAGSRQIAETLTPHTGRAQVLGLTGAPGVGKSTSTAALVEALRTQEKRVAVLAVDPSSPFSGGALLGDRVRMQDHATDADVFIRSMASRGHLGGVSAAAPQVLRVLDAAGFDVIVVETVGVGQAEVEIAALADTTVVLLAPGMGDSIQAAKAGILEIADVFVVNKADRDGADQAARDLRSMLSLAGAHQTEGTWRAPIVKTVAVRGEGIVDLLAAIGRHREWMTGSGELMRRRSSRARVEIESIALAQVRTRMALVHGLEGLSVLAQQVAAGQLDPFAAAAHVLGAATA